MDSPDEAFIAGGGLWPEPYSVQLAAGTAEFFLGLDAKGALQYFDGYNALEVRGYHREEWYVRLGMCLPAMSSG